MSGLRLYNTLTRTKEDFVPLDPTNVRMYVCGPTVYDFAHIGNARPAIVFDVLFRLLRHLYGEAHVTYVRNITDVDDKINARAHEVAEAKSIPIEAAREEITAVTAKQYQDDVAALGCLSPTREPRATEYIRQMIQMIEHLIKMGHAYEASGHVLYDVASKPDYGKLARRSLDEMIAGSRVDVAPYKQNPMDFVLWKPSTPELPGWHSPWGRGRPGWHIECSAMADALLGETFDIHGGGIDLLFPHHENEVAQSEGAHAGAPPARVWMHNGFLQVEGEKMSKSLGNFVTIRELLSSERFGGRSWPGQVLRFAMLSTHYRQPIDWASDLLVERYRELQSWANFVAQSYGIVQTDLHRPSDAVVSALSDDLNTPQAITELRNLFSHRDSGEAEAAVQILELCEFLGLLNRDQLFGYNPYHVGTGPQLVPPNLRRYLDELQVASLNRDARRVEELRQRLLGNGVIAEVKANGAISYQAEHSGYQAEVERLLAERNEARKAKNFRESDRIRDELLAKGIQLKDNPDGTTSWEVKR